MKKEIFFLAIFIFFLTIFEQVFAQQQEPWPGIFIICRIANFFSYLVLFFCILGGLKVGYDIMMSKGSAEEFYSAKKALLFILIGGALALSYLLFISGILGLNVC